MGDRDSEVAVVIQGKKFASSLRHQIWSVALGINEFAKIIFGYLKVTSLGFWGRGSKNYFCFCLFRF